MAAGDQPQAIEKLVAGLVKGCRMQTLLGVTGYGKTFAMAKATCGPEIGFLLKTTCLD